MPEPAATWDPVLRAWLVPGAGTRDGRAPLFPAAWPPEGATRNGMLFPRPRPRPACCAGASVPSPWRGLPTPRATDGTKGSPNQHGSSGDLMLTGAVMRLPPPGPPGAPGGPPGPGWGPYEAAVRGWERVTGRAAPWPAEPGPSGRQRLSPAFVEWMMDLEPGWVSGVPGLARASRLRILGNGVVPRQAVLALEVLLGRTGAPPAAQAAGQAAGPAGDCPAGPGTPGESAGRQRREAALRPVRGRAR